MIHDSWRVVKTRVGCFVGTLANGDVARISLISSARGSCIKTSRVSERRPIATGVKIAGGCSLLSIQASANEEFDSARREREWKRPTAKTRDVHETYRAIGARRGRLL